MWKTKNLDNIIIDAPNVNTLINDSPTFACEDRKTGITDHY